MKKKYTPEELRNRHSVRSFSVKPVDESLVNKLKSIVTMINSHESGLNFQLVFNDGNPFRGFTRSYGMFKNVSNYLACVIDPSFPNAAERAGFFAQQFVMEAVTLGLGTCFVGGTFSRKDCNVSVRVYENIPFIVAFGYPEGKPKGVYGFFTGLMHRKDKKPREFFAGPDSLYDEAINKFSFLTTGLEAVASAPSSLNRQPVRLTLKNAEGENSIVAFTSGSYEKEAVDLGIAKFNFASAVGGDWEWGPDSLFYPDQA